MVIVINFSYVTCTYSLKNQLTQSDLSQKFYLTSDEQKFVYFFTVNGLTMNADYNLSIVVVFACCLLLSMNLLYLFNHLSHDTLLFCVDKV